jgi:hypothetical protein
VAALAGIAAHGGVGGAIVEVLLVVTILAVFVAVWLRERRASSNDEDGGEDQIRPQ